MHAMQCEWERWTGIKMVEIRISISGGVLLSFFCFVYGMASYNM